MSGINPEDAKRLISEIEGLNTSMEPPAVEQESVLAIGEQAPKFSGTAVWNGEFEDISFDHKYLSGRWVYLFFYPLAFTFACPTELVELSKRISEFNERDCAVVGVAVDSKFATQAWEKVPVNEGGLGGNNAFPLLEDLTREISNDYRSLGPAGHTHRSTILIDPSQNVRYISIQDPPVGRNIDEMLRLVDGYQFHEEHGEICPVNWYIFFPYDDRHKGDATIDADHADAYFSKL